MTHVIADRVKETTNTTGTGPFGLAGQVSGFVPFSDKLTANGDTTWYGAVNGAEWEVGLGTRVSAGSLARTTVIASSNAGALVNFSASPVVYCTVPASKMSAVGPSFSATLGSDQTFSSGIFTKVAVNSEQFDNGSCFDSTGNYRFQPNVAGVYQVSWMVTFKCTGAMLANTYTSYLYKNGVQFANSNYANCTTTIAGLGGSALVYLNGTTDYIELFAVCSASSGTLTFGAGAGETNFSAYLAALPGPPLLGPAKPLAARAYLSADQTVTTATWTKVALNAESFDYGDCFDSVTNYRFTPNVPGLYRVEACVSCYSTGGSLSDSSLKIYKNGAAYVDGTYGLATTDYRRLVTSDLVWMNGSTDYLELYGYVGGTGTLKFTSGSVETRLSVSLVRAD